MNCRLKEKNWKFLKSIKFATSFHHRMHPEINSSLSTLMLDGGRCASSSACPYQVTAFRSLTRTRVPVFWVTWPKVVRSWSVWSEKCCWWRRRSVACFSTESSGSRIADSKTQMFVYELPFVLGFLRAGSSEKFAVRLPSFEFSWVKWKGDEEVTELRSSWWILFCSQAFDL